jgi:hypothetical protein
MNEDENGFVHQEEIKRQVLYKILYGEPSIPRTSE